MRTIQLREYQPKTETLESNELEQILSTKLVGVAPTGTRGEYILRAESIVGTVVLDGIRLLIRPKVDLQNLFFMLGYSSNLIDWDELRFPYEQDPDLTKVIARLFEAEVASAIPRGLVRGYQSREETLSSLRGRVDIATQVQKRQGRSYPIDCRFEEFTEDIQLNRVLKAAHHKLLRLPVLEPEIARRLSFRRRSFVDVEAEEYRRGGVPELAFNRLNQHWESAGRLATLILEHQGIRDRMGERVAISFLVDMNKVFEKFVETITAGVAERTGLELERQAGRKLTAIIAMRPDLVLRRSGRDCAVGDVKYKETDAWPHADLYQLLAYCVALGLPRGLLIYAGFRPLETHRVMVAGTELEIVGVDLTGSPAQILRGTTAAVERLVAHASMNTAAA